MVGYAFDTVSAGETWATLARTCSPEILWNLCHDISDAYATARKAEASEWRRAVAEKCTRVTRRRGSGEVRILAA